MKKIYILVLVFCMIFAAGCSTSKNDTVANEQTEDASQQSVHGSESSRNDEKQLSEEATEETTGVDNNVEEKTMKMMIGNTEVPVTWEDNDSVAELKTLLPLTINMSMYGGFEQVGTIGRSITRDDKQTTTNYGDIVLYSGNQIVVFYGSNSWSYTRLGHVELTQQEMTDLLSNGDVTITILKD